MIENLQKYLPSVVDIIAILFVLVTHEFAHAYVAYKNGDDTAKRMGRLSFNPLAHLSLVGTISMIVFRFGWAKPVPINPIKFKNRRLGMFTVSIAGIVINLVTAFIAMIILVNLQSVNWFFYLIRSIASYGVLFAVFNFIPIPPLDGSKILASFLPIQFEQFMYKYQQVFMIILIMLISFGYISRYLGPAVNFVYNAMLSILI